MSREIKFRAWDKVKEEMCDVMGIDFIQNMVLCFPITKRTARAGKWRPMDEFELMQFTGRHDKNGVEIYEGDIIGTNVRYQILPKYIVEWNEKHCCFTCIDGGTFNYLGDIDESIQYHLLSNMRLNVCEIIGNIYENPELGAAQCEPCK